MAYADIHHFEVANETNLVDDDGDTLCGWYFQLMEDVSTALSDLMGPYYSRSECEEAASQEWEG